MAERRRRPDLTPRWLTIGEVAQYLGHSASWLTPERLVRLQKTGFPLVDGSLERIDREAIDDWSDRRSGRQHIFRPRKLPRRRPTTHHRRTRIHGLGQRASYGMTKLEIDLPDYVVAKRQKGTRKNDSVPYLLYYWQPWKELRAAGFRSVALGRDLTKAVAAAKRLNDHVAA